jgi:hypothetical protein
MREWSLGWSAASAAADGEDIGMGGFGFPPERMEYARQDRQLGLLLFRNGVPNRKC